MVPSALRAEYSKGQLLEENLALSPVEQFGLWFNEAEGSGAPEPNACTLATATRDGVPSARIVLLKGYDASGFTFFTNYESRKGRELADNPHAALVFFWAVLERQVRIVGTVSRVSREETEAYFASRPRGSQLGAWASAQSATIPNRDELEARFRELTERYSHEAPPAPPHWGGYRLAPVEIEFWQGRASRLHDRLRYRLAQGQWIVERLSP